MTEFFASAFWTGFLWPLIIMVAESLLLLVVLLSAIAYILLADRKIWAAVQIRRGPNVVGPFGLFQSFADLLKFVLKEPTIPAGANKGVFLLAPLVSCVLALAGTAASDSITYGNFGLRAHLSSFDLGGVILTPRLDLGLQHGFQAFAPRQTVMLGAAGFTASGSPLARDAFVAGAGFDLALSPTAHLSLGYDGTMASRGASHAVHAALRLGL